MIEEIDPNEASRRVSAGALLVDVREPDEFAQARVAGATLVPLSVFAARLDELPRDREVVLMCAAGVRSLNAAAFAAQRGYRVVNLAGGIQAWHAAGLPVELGHQKGARA